MNAITVPQWNADFFVDGAYHTQMKARQTINGAPFGPDALKVVGQAFDKAWAQIATFFGNDPVMIEGARLTLASAILSMASDESRDVGALKHAGIQAMAEQYKLQPKLHAQKLD